MEVGIRSAEAQVCNQVDWDDIEVTLELAACGIEFREFVHKIYVIIESLAVQMVLALQEYTQSLESLKEVHDFVEMIECVKCSGSELTSDQMTKASYRRNIILQNRRYDTKMRLSKGQSMKARRPRIIRRLP